MKKSIFFTKKLFFTFSFILFVVNLNAQTEFAPIGAEWYYSYSDGYGPEKHFNHVISEKDTIVEGNTCRVLRQYYDNSTVASEKYIVKQEQGKVYYYYQDKFHLLLDFDAEVNDIIEPTFIYRKSDFEHYSYKDTVLSVKYLVEDITINAQNLKTFTAKGMDEVDYGDGIHRPPRIYAYTERIGLYGEFMPMFNNTSYPCIEYYRGLRCYSDADISLVSDEWAAMSLLCSYPVDLGTHTLNDENIKIYTNPVNDHIFVFTNDGGNIKIIDVSGKVVYVSKISNGMNEISTNHLPQGVYFVKIQHKDNHPQIFKIIKS